jgi:hypothetical protein
MAAAGAGGGRDRAWVQEFPGIAGSLGHPTGDSLLSGMTPHGAVAPVGESHSHP